MSVEDKLASFLCESKNWEKKTN